jgi:DNA-binding MarR family transcriptional regulator
MDKVRVSRAVSALERRALLARQRSARDQRAAELTLTDRGRALFAEIAPRAEAWEAKLLAPLSAHQHQQIRASLTLLRGCIDQLEQDG